MRKIFIMLAVWLLLMSSTVYARGKYVNMTLTYDGEDHWYNAEEITLEINGREPSDLPMPPVLLNNYTLVPAREVFEGLGADVEWKNDTREVFIYHENTTVVIEINSTTALVNGAEKEMDIPAKIINNKTMIPLRFVSQAIDKEVGWDGSTRTASVKDKPHTAVIVEETTEATTEEPTEEPTTIATTKAPVTTTQAVQEKQLINKIEFSNTPGADIISIGGEKYAPEVNVVRSTDGKLLTIDVENGTLSVDKKDFGKGNFVQNGYYYQLSEKYIRISIELNDTVKYNISKNGNTTMVVLSEGGADYNVSSEDYSYVGNNFTFDDNKLIINDPNGLINLKNVQYTENYLDAEYIINIPTNLTSILSSTSFSVKNDYVDSVDINTSSYGTTVNIHAASIVAITAERAGSYTVFKVVKPYEKYDRILVLDAGHGLQDTGATGNGLVEKELTLDIVQRAAKLFDADGTIKVYCTRLEDTYPTLWERQEMASAIADVFVSVHINSNDNPNPSGTETYILYPNDHGNGLTSYMLGEKLLDNLLDALGTVNRGVKSEDFIVLKGTKPSTLLEIGFISNAGDAAIMGEGTNRQKIAQAIFDGVKELLDDYPPVR